MLDSWSLKAGLLELVEGKFVVSANYASMGMWRDSLRRLPPIGFFVVEIRGAGQ